MPFCLIYKEVSFQKGITVFSEILGNSARGEPRNTIKLLSPWGPQTHHHTIGGRTVPGPLPPTLPAGCPARLLSQGASQPHVTSDSGHPAECGVRSPRRILGTGSHIPLREGTVQVTVARTGLHSGPVGGLEGPSPLLGGPRCSTRARDGPGRTGDAMTSDGAPSSSLKTPRGEQAQPGLARQPLPGSPAGHTPRSATGFPTCNTTPSLVCTQTRTLGSGDTWPVPGSDHGGLMLSRGPWGGQPSRVTSRRSRWPGSGPGEAVAEQGRDSRRAGLQIVHVRRSTFPGKITKCIEFRGKGSVGV